jgi:hypothetical protein
MKAALRRAAMRFGRLFRQEMRRIRHTSVEPRTTRAAAGSLVLGGAFAFGLASFAVFPGEHSYPVLLSLLWWCSGS